MSEISSALHSSRNKISSDYQSKLAFFEYVRSAPGFKSFAAASNILHAAVNASQCLSTNYIQDIQGRLLDAETAIANDPAAPHGLPMRIATTRILTPIAATIPEWRSETLSRQGSSDGYSERRMGYTYAELTMLGAEALMQYENALENEDDAAAGAYKGILAENMFLAVRARNQKIAIPASVNDDFFNRYNPHDILAFDYHDDNIYETKIQIKSKRPVRNDIKRMERLKKRGVLPIVASRNLRNNPEMAQWDKTSYAAKEMPTIRAMIGELTGNTSGSAVLDFVSESLYQTILSHRIELKTESKQNHRSPAPKPTQTQRTRPQPDLANRRSKNVF